MNIITEDNSIKELVFIEKKTKHKFEFQELCSELEPIYGKRIWTVPFIKGFTEYKIRKANEIAHKANIININYLIGIIKKI